MAANIPLPPVMGTPIGVPRIEYCGGRCGAQRLADGGTLMNECHPPARWLNVGDCSRIGRSTGFAKKLDTPSQITILGTFDPIGKANLHLVEILG